MGHNYSALVASVPMEVCANESIDNSGEDSSMNVHSLIKAVVYAVEIGFVYLLGRAWRKIIVPILGSAGFSLSSTESIIFFGILLIIVIVGIQKLNAFLRKKYLDSNNSTMP